MDAYSWAEERNPGEAQSQVVQEAAMSTDMETSAGTERAGSTITSKTTGSGLPTSTLKLERARAEAAGTQASSPCPQATSPHSVAIRAGRARTGMKTIFPNVTHRRPIVGVGIAILSISSILISP